MILYAVTMVDIRDGRSATSNCRCVGIFKEFEEAEGHLMDNMADVAEGGTNKYAVIEELKANQFYPMCVVKQWYIYDHNPTIANDGVYWRTEEPEWAKGIINWGIG